MSEAEMMKLVRAKWGKAGVAQDVGANGKHVGRYRVGRVMSGPFPMFEIKGHGPTWEAACEAAGLTASRKVAP